MRFSGVIRISVMCAIAVMAAAGCSRQQPVSVPAPPPLVQAPPHPDAGEEPIIPHDDVKQKLTDMIAKDAGGDHVFPQGVKVLRVTVKDAVAAVDFSKEFSALANSGESTESAAQKLIRRTLSKEQGIERVSVSVEGHSFDSQATDWSTPFPVKPVAGEPKPASDVHESSSSGVKPSSGKEGGLGQ